MSASARSTARLVAFLLLLAGGYVVFWSMSCDTDNLGERSCQAAREPFGPFGIVAVVVALIVFGWTFLAGSSGDGGGTPPG